MHSFLTCRYLPAFALAAVVSLVAGIAIGKMMPDERCMADYQFVNPDVACGESDVIRKTGYAEMRGTLLEQIRSAEKSGVERVSVYFRDLERGPVMGINELDAFAPASLLKLPLAFVFLSAAEDQPALLQQKITFSGTTSRALQRIEPLESAEQGNEYTVDELLRMMIAFSDNASYEILEGFLGNAPQRMLLRLETFQELGLIDPKDRVESTITVRGYSSLFRILYNASYLSVDNSDKMLAWLVASEYTDGIVRGVPAGTIVAHKFGERSHDDGANELHDCGIIYYPDNPYLLCIMTRGTDWDAQTRLIEEISRTVYEEVDSRRL